MMVVIVMVSLQISSKSDIKHIIHFLLLVGFGLVMQKLAVGILNSSYRTISLKFIYSIQFSLFLNIMKIE